VEKRTFRILEKKEPLRLREFKNRTRKTRREKRREKKEKHDKKGENRGGASANPPETECFWGRQGGVTWAH